MANIGLLPHADLPHILPFFRLARALSTSGHAVHLVGSEVLTVSRGHGAAWRSQLRRYGLGDRQLLHRDPGISFTDWLRQVITAAQLDVLIVDAVWQAVSHALVDLPRTVTMVHHAGLPDFRTEDMPPWQFIHPGHARAAHDAARRDNERRETEGPGVRRLLLSLNPGLAPDAPGARFAFGCGEFAAPPALRAMSLCPAAEFPGERGRVEYLGSQLPEPHDRDWQAPPLRALRPSQTLIACVFGTTGLKTRAEYRWLLDASHTLAGRYTRSQVITVIPDRMRSRWPLRRLPANLLVVPWIPLWELLRGHAGTKLLVTPPGVGAFRDAIASGTPLIALPRRSDQFGAAARTEYFGLGSACVSSELPPHSDLLARVAGVLDDAKVQRRAADMRDAVRTYDETAPLQRVIAQLRGRS